MKTKKLSMRTMALIVLWPISSSWVLAQGLDAPFDSSEQNQRDGSLVSAADIASSFRLKGTIVSQSGSSALVNNKISREGDLIGGAEILDISEGAVRILAGSREYTVRVGSSVITEQRSEPNVTQPSMDTRDVPVQPGETLSEIAQRHLTGGVTMNQMMLAMFNANPHAFGDNINVLRAGTAMRIPNQKELHEQSPATATVAVARHMDAWQSGNEPKIQFADAVDSDTYGPVVSGETLSEIAVKVTRSGATMNQMMIALAEANPEAFGGNINMLHRGAVLKIPDEAELIRHAPDAATAEVLRHMQEWQPDDWLQPKLASTSDPNNLPARS